MLEYLYFFLCFFCCPLLAYVGFYRNQEVYKYQIRLADKVYDAGKRDIDLGLDWEWRYKELNAVPYHKMVLMFWKPLKSFYPDLRFTQTVFLPIVCEYMTIQDQLDLEVRMSSIPRRSYHSVH